jgi:hypothetical protein
MGVQCHAARCHAHWAEAGFGLTCAGGRCPRHPRWRAVPPSRPPRMGGPKRASALRAPVGAAPGTPAGGPCRPPDHPAWVGRSGLRPYVRRWALASASPAGVSPIMGDLHNYLRVSAPGHELPAVPVGTCSLWGPGAAPRPGESRGAAARPSGAGTGRAASVETPGRAAPPHITTRP